MCNQRYELIWLATLEIQKNTKYWIRIYKWKWEKCRKKWKLLTLLDVHAGLAPSAFRDLQSKTWAQNDLKKKKYIIRKTATTTLQICSVNPLIPWRLQSRLTGSKIMRLKFLRHFYFWFMDDWNQDINESHAVIH